MTTQNHPAENGCLPSEFLTYPCNPDQTAIWRQDRNYVKAKLLRLQGGAYAYGVDFALKNEGQVGPLSADRSAANLEAAIAALQEVIENNICETANRHGLKREVVAISKFGESLADPGVWEAPEKLDLTRPPVVDDAAIGELMVAVSEQDARTRAIAAQVGYQLPADSTAPDLICRDIAANMRRSVEACLEIGRALITLKAACPHGEYLQRIDALGIEESVARRFTQTAIKFSNRATSHDLLKAIGSQSKLFEFLMLDDEQIEELELTGQTGELKLDDVASMSVKELRGAVRKLRGDLNVKEAVAKTNQETIQGLQEALELKQKARQEATDDAEETERAAALKEINGAVQGVIGCTEGIKNLLSDLLLRFPGPLADQTLNATVREIIATGRQMAEDFNLAVGEAGSGKPDVDTVDPGADNLAAMLAARGHAHVVAGA